MFSIRDVIDPGSRMLARRIEQLCSTLNNIGASVRDAVAAAVGETLSGIIRDAVLRVVEEITDRLPGSDPGTNSSRTSPRAYLPRYLDDDDGDHWENAVDKDEFESEVAEPPVRRATERLSTALATGLRAASWWLRRCPGPGSAWSTLAVGAIVATAAFFGGPIVVAVLGVAESASHFSFVANALEQSSAPPPGLH